MAVLRGENLMVFIAEKTDSGNEELTSIAYATNHTLNINLSTTETSNKDQGHGDWQTFEQGTMSWDISSDNLIGNGQGKVYADMLEYMLAKKILKVAFAIASEENMNKGDYALDNVPDGGWKIDETTDTNIYYVGNVIITSISTNAPNNDSASYTVSMQGVGEFKRSANLKKN